MAVAVGFAHLLAGFDNHRLTELVATLLDHPYTGRQATYDLRRLKRKALIERLSHSNRYQLTPLGRQVMVLFTKTYGHYPLFGPCKRPPQNEIRERSCVRIHHPSNLKLKATPYDHVADGTPKSG